MGEGSGEPAGVDGGAGIRRKAIQGGGIGDLSRQEPIPGQGSICFKHGDKKQCTAAYSQQICCQIPLPSKAQHAVKKRAPHLGPQSIRSHHPTQRTQPLTSAHKASEAITQHTAFSPSSWPKMQRQPSPNTPHSAPHLGPQSIRSHHPTHRTQPLTSAHKASDDHHATQPRGHTRSAPNPSRQQRLPSPPLRIRVRRCCSTR